MKQVFFKTQFLSEEEGYRLTLTSRLGIMLREVEALFGKRDKTWTILGIEFEENGPYIWYPADSKNVLIRLSTGVEESLREACWELSHEVVHLLSPTGGAHANVLEEGLAVWYSKHYVLREFAYDHANTVPAYDHAYQLVKSFMNSYPSSIKEMRKEQKTLSLIDKNLLLKYIPGLSREDAITLTTKFAK